MSVALHRLLLGSTQWDNSERDTFQLLRVKVREHVQGYHTMTPFCFREQGR